MSAAIDTTRTLSIDASPGKLLALTGGGVLMTALSFAIAIPLLPNFEPGGLVKFTGWFGTLFFGLCTAIALKRLLAPGAPVVTISPQGIRDTRISADLIPWLAVHGLSTWSLSGTDVLVIAVDPEVERGLNLSAVARWSRKANKALGADGLCVTAQGLKIDYATLFQTCAAYAQASRGA